jgi:hypothetical protein
MVSINELTLTDVEFLQTVKDVNNHPEKYNHTDKGERPANSKSIRLASSLNANQVSYRMGGNSNSRGFAESDNYLINTYEPVKNDSGFGPRSANLTEKGENMLKKAQEQVNEISGISRAEFEELQEKVDEIRELHSRIDEIWSSIEYIRDHFEETTGVDPLTSHVTGTEAAALMYWEVYDAANELDYRPSRRQQ